MSTGKARSFIRFFLKWKILWKNLGLGRYSIHNNLINFLNYFNNNLNKFFLMGKKMMFFSWGYAFGN